MQVIGLPTEDGDRYVPPNESVPLRTLSAALTNAPETMRPDLELALGELLARRVRHGRLVDLQAALKYLRSAALRLPDPGRAAEVLREVRTLEPQLFHEFNFGLQLERGLWLNYETLGRALALHAAQGPGDDADAARRRLYAALLVAESLDDDGADAEPDAWAVVLDAESEGTAAFERYAELGFLGLVREIGSHARRIATTTRQRDAAEDQVLRAQLHWHRIANEPCGGGPGCAFVQCAEAFESQRRDDASLAEQGQFANDLSTAWSYAFDHDHDPATIGRAVDALTGMVELLRAHRGVVPGLFTNYGAALRRRWEVTEDPADLDAGIAAHEEATRASSDDHPEACHHWLAYGHGLGQRAVAGGDPRDADGMAAAYGKAYAIACGRTAALRSHVAADWALYAERLGRWSEARDAATRAREAMRRAADAEERRPDKEVWLRRFADVNGRVAFCTARAGGDLVDAALALESGRLTLLDGDVAAEVSIGDLLGASSDPAAYLVSAEAGGLAIVVHDGRVTAVDLPHGAWREVDGLVSRLDRLRATPGPDAERDLDAVLGELWPLVEPVLAAAGQPSRLRIIACGNVARLPLHAAWRSDPTSTTGRRYLDESCQLGYLAALRSARTVVSAGDDVLQVVEPATTARPLRFARRGADTVRSTVERRGGRTTMLSREQATVDAVTDELPGHGVVLLDCHGVAYEVDALATALLLAGDRRLTVRDLATSDGLAIRLAVLAACDSGRIGSILLDEMVGLPATLVRAGAQGVVASLWPLADQPAALITAAVIAAWYRRDVDPLDALGVARRFLREATNAELARRFPRIVRVPPAADAAWFTRQPFRERPSCWAGVTLLGT